MSWALPRIALLLVAGAGARAPAGTALPAPWLDHAQVRATLHGAQGAFEACFAPAVTERTPPPSRWAAQLDLEVDARGAVRTAALKSGTPLESVEACLRVVACGLRFPAAGIPGERWSYTVAWSEGQVQPFPTVGFSPRPAHPLLMAPPEGMDAPALAALRGAFGADPWAPPQGGPLAPCVPPAAAAPEPDAAR